MIFHKNEKCIGAIVAIILLMLITVISIGAYQNWFTGYQTVIMSKTENDGNTDQMKTGISNLLENRLYFINNNIDDISITNIKVNDVSCDKSLNVSPGVSEIVLNNCIDLNIEGVKNVVVITTNKIFEKKFLLVN